MNEEANKWRTIATMFYDRHDNRRNCSLLSSCKQCDAYEQAVSDEQKAQADIQVQTES